MRAAAPEIDRAILAGFVLGLSTRKVGETLLALLGRPVSATTVSRVAKTLDSAVAAFHRRPLHGRYSALMLDGVVLARKTGAGALRRPVLVALGLRPDGKKEIIDFRLAAGESAVEWERFLDRSLPARPDRPRSRHDLRRWRQGPLGGPADGLSRHPGPALLGAQNPQCPQQSSQSRSAARQARAPQGHECRQYLTSPRGCAAASPIASRTTIPPPSLACATISTELLTCFRYKSEVRSQGRAHHKRHRTPLPRSAPPNTAHGNLPGQNLHGKNPLRRLHPRK